MNEIELPILSYTVSSKSSELFDGIKIILIQHLLTDSISLARAFRRCGAEVVLIGIPYWFNDDVIQELKVSGFEVHLPPDPMNETVEQILKTEIETCKKKQRKILVVEDGGYAFPILHNGPKDWKQSIIGVVEQTKHGYWIDKNIIEGTEQSFPLISIAESRLKEKLEPPFIGQAILTNLQLLLQKRGGFIRGKALTVVGFGAIGQKIAKALSDVGRVCIADTDIFNLVEAQLGNLDTNSTIELASNSDLIIGCTGKTSISREVILNAKSGCILASASSKRVEIDIEALNSLAKSKKVYPEGTEYILPNSKSIFLLANGYPLNFFSSNSVPDFAIDPIITELFLASCALIEKNIKPALYRIGVINDPGEYLIDEFDILSLWLSINYGKGSLVSRLDRKNKS